MKQYDYFGDRVTFLDRLRTQASLKGDKHQRPTLTLSITQKCIETLQGEGLG